MTQSDEYVFKPSNKLLGGSGILRPVIVEKTWGKEYIYINTTNYCMKKLVIKPALCSSKHFHNIKHETMYVVSGKLGVEIFNKDYSALIYQNYDDNNFTPNMRMNILSVGQTFVIPQGLVHRLWNLGNADLELIECSTFSQDSDSIRIEV